MAVLECKDLSKQYGGAPALTHVNLTIEPGRMLMGHVNYPIAVEKNAVV